MQSLQQPRVGGDIVLEGLLLLWRLLLLMLLIRRDASVHVVQVRLRLVQESVLSGREVVRCHTEDRRVLEGEGFYNGKDESKRKESAQAEEPNLPFAL
jgi:hypothetical protein